MISVSLRSLFVLLCCACAVRSSIDVSSFTGHATLKSGVYDVYWNLTEDSSIILALQVTTTGWVGFAIGEQTSGSMPGADFVTGWVLDSSMEASIQDRYTFDYVMPSVDACQDWVLLDSDQSGGVTTLVVKRALETGDNQDRPITSGPMKVLYAYGASDTFGYHGPNSRSEASIEFWPSPDYVSPQNNSATVYTYDILMNNSQIPAQETTYYCQTFKLPDLSDGQIIQIDPIVQINPNAQNLVHHFLAYSCYMNESNWNTNPYPQTCDAVPAQCNNLFFVWAVGSGPLVLPNEAGFRIGNNKTYSFKYLVLQVHYNNVNLLSGLTDNSGIRIHYTTSALRPNDAGILDVGDVWLSFPPLAAGQQSIALESECPSQCTQKFPNDINVFADILHMHEVGSHIWNTHWSNGSMVIENRVDFWDFALQTLKPVNYTIKRGDSFHLHCTYNTMNSASAIDFGLASSQEMCLNYLAYYPIMTNEYGTYEFCGNVIYDNNQLTVCGPQNDPGLFMIPPILNPSTPDPPGSGTILFGTPCSSTPTLAPNVTFAPTSIPTPTVTQTPSSSASTSTSSSGSSSTIGARMSGASRPALWILGIVACLLPVLL